MGINKEKVVVTNDYEYNFSDDDGNIITVPTYEKLPSANFGPALVEYLKSHPLIAYTFRENVNYYNREDYDTRTLPALNVFSISEKMVGGSTGWLNGKMGIRLIIPIEFKRDSVADFAMTLCNKLNFLIGMEDVFAFMAPYCPGLSRVNYNAEFSYKNCIVFEKGSKRQINAYDVSGVAEYQVNMVNYLLAADQGISLDKVNVQVNMETVSNG